MNLLATLAEAGVTPAVTVHNAFTYRGHTMNVVIFEDPSGYDISWTVETVDSRAIKDGVFPKHFAEMEACEHISQTLAEFPEADGLDESAKFIIRAISACIVNGYFKEAN